LTISCVPRSVNLALNLVQEERLYCLLIKLTKVVYLYLFVNTYLILCFSLEINKTIEMRWIGLNIICLLREHQKRECGGFSFETLIIWLFAYAINAYNN
jgi:hypothetical protein